jgi:hypothetical protein
MSAYQNLTTLYRGEPSPFSSLGRSSLMKGRWFTPNPEFARGYANYPGGVVRSVDATASEIAKANKFKNYLKYTKNLGTRISPNPEVMIAPRSLLNKASINWGQTLKHNVDVSKLAAQLYGPKILQKGIGALRIAGLTNPIAAAGTAAYYTPQLINKLTERDPNATETSLFGIDLTQNANEQAALPESNLADWGSPFGDVPGDEEALDLRNLAVQQRHLSQQRNIPGTPIVPVGAEAYGHSRGVTDTGGYSGPPTRSFDPVAAQPQRQTQPGGFTNPGPGSYGPWMSHGGLAGILEV